MADIYEHPTIAGLAGALDAMAAPRRRHEPRGPAGPASRPSSARSLFTVPLRTLTGAAVADLDRGRQQPRRGAARMSTGCRPFSWWWVGLGWLLLVLARRAGWLLGAVGARLLLRGVGPGTYPRGGSVHLRLWLAERLADELGAANLAGAPLMQSYARALGATVGADVDLHSLPPVTGLLDARRRLLGRARGRPDRALARRRRAARRAAISVGARRPGRRAQHAVPGRRRRRAEPRWRPGRPSSGRAGRRVLVRRARRERRGAARGPVVRRPSRRTGRVGAGVRRHRRGHLPAAAPRGRRRHWRSASPWLRRRARRSGTPRRAAGAAAGGRASSGWSCWRC